MGVGPRRLFCALRASDYGREAPYIDFATACTTIEGARDNAEYNDRHTPSDVVKMFPVVGFMEVDTIPVEDTVERRQYIRHIVEEMKGHLLGVNIFPAPGAYRK